MDLEVGPSIKNEGELQIEDISYRETHHTFPSNLTRDSHDLMIDIEGSIRADSPFRLADYSSRVDDSHSAATSLSLIHNSGMVERVEDISRSRVNVDLAFNNCSEHIHTPMTESRVAHDLSVLSDPTRLVSSLKDEMDSPECDLEEFEEASHRIEQPSDTPHVPLSSSPSLVSRLPLNNTVSDPQLTYEYAESTFDEVSHALNATKYLTRSHHSTRSLSNRSDSQDHSTSAPNDPYPSLDRSHANHLVKRKPSATLQHQSDELHSVSSGNPEADHYNLSTYDSSSGAQSPVFPVAAPTECPEATSSFISQSLFSTTQEPEDRAYPTGFVALSYEVGGQALSLKTEANQLHRSALIESGTKQISDDLPPSSNNSGSSRSQRSFNLSDGTHQSTIVKGAHAVTASQIVDRFDADLSISTPSMAHQKSERIPHPSTRPREESVSASQYLRTRDVLGVLSAPVLTEEIQPSTVPGSSSSSSDSQVPSNGSHLEGQPQCAEDLRLDIPHGHTAENARVHGVSDYIPGEMLGCHLDFKSGIDDDKSQCNSPMSETGSNVVHMPRETCSQELHRATVEESIDVEAIALGNHETTLITPQDFLETAGFDGCASNSTLDFTHNKLLQTHVSDTSTTETTEDRPIFKTSDTLQNSSVTQRDSSNTEVGTLCVKQDRKPIPSVMFFALPLFLKSMVYSYDHQFNLINSDLVIEDFDTSRHMDSALRNVDRLAEDQGGIASNEKEQKSSFYAGNESSRKLEFQARPTPQELLDEQQIPETISETSSINSSPSVELPSKDEVYAQSDSNVTSGSQFESYFQNFTSPSPSYSPEFTGRSLSPVSEVTEGVPGDHTLPTPSHHPAEPFGPIHQRAESDSSTQRGDEDHRASLDQNVLNETPHSAESRADVPEASSHTSELVDRQSREDKFTFNDETSRSTGKLSIVFPLYLASQNPDCQLLY